MTQRLMFIYYDKQLEELYRKVKISSIENENLIYTSSYNRQMHRMHLGFNKIPNVEQYEWFVRTRPDNEIISFDYQDTRFR